MPQEKLGSSLFSTILGSGHESNKPCSWFRESLKILFKIFMQECVLYTCKHIDSAWKKKGTVLIFLGGVISRGLYTLSRTSYTQILREGGGGWAGCTYTGYQMRPSLNSNKHPTIKMKTTCPVLGMSMKGADRQSHYQREWSLCGASLFSPLGM